MAVNTKFELYKLQRELKRAGVDYTVKRYQVNQYGEPDTTVEPVEVGTLRAIYHEQNGTIQYTVGEGSMARTVKLPMLLCEYTAWTELGMQTGDYVEVNGKHYTVVGITNVQEWSIVGDISLEVFDDATKD